MTIEQFNKLYATIMKYIPDELHADDDLTLIQDGLGEIRRNYVLKHRKNEKRSNNIRGKDF